MTIPRRLPRYSLLDGGAESPNTVPKEGVLSKKLQRPPPRDISQAQRRRILRFAKYDEVFEIPHIDDLSREEVGSVWMNRRELEDIRRRARAMVSLIDDGPNFGGRSDGDDLCIRGLDQHTASYHKKQKVIQNLIYEAVFRLQGFHSYTSAQEVDVQGLIAEFCTQFSSTSAAAAVQRAHMDSSEVNSLE
jgi:hypothetical protein